MRALTFLPWPDWLAIIIFFTSWVGYTLFSHWLGQRRHSILASTNRYRKYWMLQTIDREPRMLDGIITQSTSSMPSFFSSTTIIIIGGLFALLGSNQEAAELVREIPFADRTTVLVFDLKIMLLIGIFVFAFFRFTWSMRQNSFVSLLIGSMPPPQDFQSGKYDRKAYAERAGKMLGLAAETFNGGLRAYYFAFAAIAWFFSPTAFVIATAFVVLILYVREFRSDVLKLLEDEI